MNACINLFYIYPTQIILFTFIILIAFIVPLYKLNKVRNKLQYIDNLYSEIFKNSINSEKIDESVLTETQKEFLLRLGRLVKEKDLLSSDKVTLTKINHELTDKTKTLQNVEVYIKNVIESSKKNRNYESGKSRVIKTLSDIPMVSDVSNIRTLVIEEDLVPCKSQSVTTVLENYFDDYLKK
jgi:hypothetical protein